MPESTVEYYIRQINSEVFLPGLQREFVWSPDEITHLFDSLMREYPIGAIVYWDVSDTEQPYTSYEFIQRYLSDNGAVKITPKFGDREYTQSNKRVAAEDCRRLIIDGQQRLNSLYIGLRGSILKYTAGSSGKRTTKEDWSELELCINVLGHPKAQFDGSDFEFRFIPVDQLSQPDLESVEPHVDVESLSRVRCKYEGKKTIWVSLPSLFDDEGRWSDANVSDLPNTPHHSLIGKVIRMFEANVLNHQLAEDMYGGPSTDVKTVFQRLNTKGHSPKPYQLLMSKMMSSWAFGPDACYPREDIVDFIQEFRTEFEEFSDLIDRSTFLRYLCYLHGTELRKGAIEEVGPDTLENMKVTWQAKSQFKSGLRKAFETARAVGFTDKTFDSSSILALIGRFYYESNAKVDEKNKSEILRFLSLCILLNDAYDIKRRSKARKMSQAMHSAEDEEATFADYDVFPTDIILAKSNIYPSAEAISDFIKNARYDVSSEDDRSVFKTEDAAAVLGLLTGTFEVLELTKYDVDHIYPQDKVKVIESACSRDIDIHRIGNLQLLQASHNRSSDRKGNKLPDEWVTSLSASSLQLLVDENHYPVDGLGVEAFTEVLSPEKYEQFVSERENRLIEHLVNELC